MSAGSVYAQMKDSVLVNKLNLSARDLLNENRFEESLATINKAEALAKTLNWPEGLLKVYATKCSIQNIYNKHYEAIATGLAGLHLAQTRKDKYFQVIFYRSLANNHDMLNNYMEAIPFYKKCVSLGNSVPSARLTLGHCYVEMGDAYRLHLHKPEEARTYIEKGVEIYKQTDSAALGYAYDYLGQTLGALKLFDQAEETFANSLNIYRKNQEDYLIPELLFHTANVFLAQKKYDKAIELASEGIVMSKKMRTTFGESEANRTLYQIYKETGNTSLALLHYENHIKLRDSLTKANIDNHFLQLKTEDQLRKQAAKLEELHQKNTRRRQWLILSSLIVLLLGSSFAVVYFRSNHKKLQAKNRRISEALLSGQATERQRLSREIRDTFGANISSMLWTLDLMQTEEISEHYKKTLAALKTNLSEAYERVNLLSKNIVSEELESQGLETSLTRLINKYNEAEKSEFQLKLPHDFKGTEPKIEFELYNIVHELLLLCRKVSCNSGIFSINLSGRKAELTFLANDSGALEKSDDLLIEQIGFRVESLAGKMEISGEKNTEMKINFRIPS